MNTPPSPAPRKSRRKPILIGVAVVLGMAAIGGIMDAVSGDGDDPAAAATTSPSPKATATKSASPQQKLRDAISKELGRGNRDEVKRLSEVTLNGDMLTVKWAINEQLTEGLTRKGARQDVVDIVKGIQKSGVKVDRAHLHGSYSMKNTYGEVNEQTVLRVLYTGETIDRIVPDRVDRDKITDLAEPGAFIAPAFRM
ncbi:MAG TPA: hypothetical protein VK020_06820 [Microlunatus sp.]|nr:hypothetical protein [Microlunatus sp.]